MIGKAFAAIIGRWQLSLGILAAVVLALSLSYCKGRSDGTAIERAKWERSIAKARERAEEANAASAEMRIEDIVKNIEAERTRNEAIDEAIPEGSPSTAPDAANRALACARLRAAGLDTPSSCSGR